MKPAERPAAQVTCALPGLVWPGPVGQLPALPGLAALLGRGKAEKFAPQRHAEWLAAQFDTDVLDWGRLRAIGAQIAGDANNTHWLCADPVSLNFVRDALIVSGSASLDIRLDESASLIATLNTSFHELGRFIAVSPTRWLLRTEQPIDVRFPPLADVIGRPAKLFQPEGANTRFWARVTNEAQVILHSHPINERRRNDHRAAINGLWLWGEDISAEGATLQSPADCLISDDAVIRALAMETGVLWLSTAMAASPAHGKAGHSWWYDDSLLEAAMTGDYARWINTLMRLDAQLFSPLAEAWQAGRLDGLRIVSPSDKALLDVRIGTRAGWKFWQGAMDDYALAKLLHT